MASKVKINLNDLESNVNEFLASFCDLSIEFENKNIKYSGNIDEMNSFLSIADRTMVAWVWKYCKNAENCNIFNKLTLSDTLEDFGCGKFAPLMESQIDKMTFSNGNGSLKNEKNPFSNRNKHRVIFTYKTKLNSKKELIEISFRITAIGMKTKLNEKNK